jgi:magnesium-protoporphyrin O-methyltransferase
MTATYDSQRDLLRTYFDRTASATWARLTSDAPVSKIRQTVRAGRTRMHGLILGWLPADMTGLRVLDAGCGTGALAVEAARRGAEVVAVDVAASLVDVARERTPVEIADRITWAAGDMLDPGFGTFDHVIAMDSLIHYRGADIVRTLAQISERTRSSIVFTFAPRTPLLTVMHAAGQLMPRSDRSPAIQPVTRRALATRISRTRGMDAWTLGRSERVKSGFYISNALELRRP